MTRKSSASHSRRKGSNAKKKKKKKNSKKYSDMFESELMEILNDSSRRSEHKKVRKVMEGQIEIRKK